MISFQGVSRVFRALALSLSEDLPKFAPFAMYFTFLLDSLCLFFIFSFFIDFCLLEIYF